MIPRFAPRRFVVASLTLAVLSACSGGSPSNSLPSVPLGPQSVAQNDGSTVPQEAPAPDVVPALPAAGSVAAAPSLDESAPSSARAPLAVAGASSGETPRSVFSFEDQVSLVDHFTYNDSPYYKMPSRYIALIENLHIHNLRGAGNGSQPETGWFAGMCANGVRHTLGFNVGVTPAYIKQQIDLYTPACVDAVEPSNEYDAYATNPAHSDPNWVRTILAEQRTIWNAVKANPAWSGITVLGPSLASAAHWKLLGNLEGISDAGNQHDGTCDGSPMTTHYKNVVQNLAFVRYSYPHKPIWVGETNYANNPATSRCAVSMPVAAKYVPRMFLVRFNLGQPKVFYNELSDVPAEGPGWGSLGLTGPDADPHPAYTALRSLLAVLPADRSAGALRALHYGIGGQTSNLYHTLLQGANGHYYLVLWLEVDSWDVKRKTALYPKAQAITLTLPSTIRSATLFSPNASYGMSRTSLAARSGMTVHVGDAPSVLELQ